MQNYKGVFSLKVFEDGQTHVCSINSGNRVTQKTKRLRMQCNTANLQTSETTEQITPINMLTNINLEYACLHASRERRQHDGTKTKSILDCSNLIFKIYAIALLKNA